MQSVDKHIIDVLKHYAEKREPVLPDDIAFMLENFSKRACFDKGYECGLIAMARIVLLSLNERFEIKQ